MWEVNEKGLGATRAFDEGLQFPHDPLGPLPVHQVARIGVRPQGGIGYHRRTPLLFLTPRCGGYFGGKVRSIIGDRLMVIFDKQNCFTSAVNGEGG